MTFGLAHPPGGMIRVGVERGKPHATLSWEDEHGVVACWAALDENHAAALVLALQAAVAEIQARAVGR